MGNKSRFAIAENIIRNFFKNEKQKVFTRPELIGVFYDNANSWKLPQYMRIDDFIDKLINKEIVIRNEISFDGYLPDKEIFLNGEASVFEMATSLINKSYLTHYTAVYLHGLTTQVPKTIYLTFEQSEKRNVDRELSQSAIDSAFSKPQRKSGTKTIYEGYTILVHNGKFSNRSGITMLGDIPVTNIERTLIDITVRPNYAGGVHSVLEIYKKSLEKISINKLIAILDNLAFIYPYHQAIGFYLEKAGIEDKKLDDLRKKKIKYNFYLTYEMDDKDYSKSWKIYYPKGM